MRVVFVHGWSVTSTDTYGGLPAALARRAPPSLKISVQHVHVAKYVSFADEVRIEDLARGLQQAFASEILPNLAKGEGFACITHSTGGPVVRQWIDLYFAGHLARCPLRHLIMLAPANHGSALAQLGKSRLSRMKFFAEGVQPGSGVLDWLELGSAQSWALNAAWLDYDCVANRLYPFVLTGQTIDRHFYDNLNSYTGEPGSDGVVRVAAANMNYGLLRLTQQGDRFGISKDGRTRPTALGVLPGLSHSGAESGILASVLADDDGSHPTLQWVIRCLGVASASAYRALAQELAALTAESQDSERKARVREVLIVPRTFVTDRYCMVVFRLLDDRGAELDDYDVIFTAGPLYDGNHLAPGFFRDRQRNQRHPGKLTYFINYDVLAGWLAKPELEGKFGFRIGARPEAGFAHYAPAEYRGTLAALKNYFEPNQTLMIEIQLTRHVTTGVFALTQDLMASDFRDQPRGSDVEA